MSRQRQKLIKSHSNQGTLWFILRVRANQIRRYIVNLSNPIPQHIPKKTHTANLTQISESRTPLWTSDDPNEQLLTLGKIQNLRVALKNWHNITISAGQTVSFWRQTGAPHKKNGFVPGRELREGCIIPSPGGGLCQLSNALYDLALKTGCEILERHPHTQVIPGSATSRDRDATVAFNHIDLRFRPTTDIQITAKVSKKELIVQFHTEPLQAKNELATQRINLPIVNQSPKSCVTCGELSCNQHDQARDKISKLPKSKRTFLIDAPTPELSEYLKKSSLESDKILCSIQTTIPQFKRYRISEISGTIAHAPLATVRRALDIRRAKSPPETRAALQNGTENIVKDLCKKIPYTSQKLIVDIAFLPYIDPFLLQGREVEVFTSRFPLKLIHELLDQAAESLPEASQLSDFRADEGLVAAEWAALEKADQIITSHPFLAHSLKLAGVEKVIVHPYVLPQKSERQKSKIPYLYFPGPTAARKGAHAVREVALATNIAVAVSGRNLESPDFWNGVKILDPNEFPAQSSIAVIAPSIYEDRPSRLLQPYVDGIPIITTHASGMPESPLVHTTEFNNLGCMIEYISKLLK